MCTTWAEEMWYPFADAVFQKINHFAMHHIRDILNTMRWRLIYLRKNKPERNIALSQMKVLSV